MSTNSAETLPKTLSGVVCPQWVKCGRPNCRCSRGELHGPYHYRFWRQRGKLRKAYVRRSDVELVRAQCQARRQARIELAAWREVWHQMVAQVREVEQR
jgi:hypothetical protein